MPDVISPGGCWDEAVGVATAPGSGCVASAVENAVTGEADGAAPEDGGAEGTTAAPHGARTASEVTMSRVSASQPAVALGEEWPIKGTPAVRG